MTTNKTNAMRILDSAGIEYKVHEYPHKDNEAVDGVTVAELLGEDPDTVYKTLVTRGASAPNRAYYVFCIPVAYELDMKAAAKAVGEKSVEMLHVKELLGITGYIRGGCSPIGMKKQFPTVIHEDMILIDTIMVSGGKIGVQVELSPDELLKVTGGKTADIARAKA
ncbi:MAG: Cys-tRNA(Pro) deacylase [Oscillospiraceae bacterium]|nr:Cys-tRNA(Pro) deacylase [Oscillospiraceae bacterium]